MASVLDYSIANPYFSPLQLTPKLEGGQADGICNALAEEDSRQNQKVKNTHAHSLLLAHFYTILKNKQ
jgi:hypothetical protein